MSDTVWFYSNTKNNRCHAGTAEAGGVTDGSLGQWLGLNPPPAENESPSLTYPGGSSSSRAWNSVTGERPWPSWAVTAQISRSRQSSFYSRAYVKMRPVSPGLYRPPSLPLAWPVCPFVTSSTLTHSPSVCSSVCLPSSINLLSVYFTKTPLSPLIFSHPSRLLFLP